MPKVKHQTDSRTRLRERRNFLHVRRRSSKIWIKKEISSGTIWSWLPHAPVLQTFEKCFSDMYTSMSMSNNLQDCCYVCYLNTNQNNLKRMNLSIDNQDEFHNLSAEIHKFKVYSSQFPKIRSNIHQRDYHIHSLNRDEISEFILVCQNCARHLKKGSSLPKFSIPNYFFPEPVPSVLQSLSLAELLMVSRVFPRCIIYTLSENPSKCHRFLKGNYSIPLLTSRSLCIIRAQHWRFDIDIAQNQGRSIQ